MSAIYEIAAVTAQVLAFLDTVEIPLVVTSFTILDIVCMGIGVSILIKLYRAAGPGDGDDGADEVEAHKARIKELY
jgi:hypothetical protein